MKISVVSPVYYGQNTVGELVRRLEQSLKPLTEAYEIILVEDGSPDESWKAIEEVCHTNKRIKGIKLSRNFGQHYAITAGLEASTGEWVVVMDCDLQDRPEAIPSLYAKSTEGYDIVFAQRLHRKDGMIKKLSSRLYYTLFSFLTGTEQDASIANFGIYHRKVILAILSMKDLIRYFPTMSQWVGFSKTKIQVMHSQREEGKSSYTWGKLIRLAFDNVIAFSDRPLRLTIRLGLLISFVSLVIGVYYLFLYFTGKIVVVGYASLIISIWFLSGLIVFILGIMGTYLGKTFDQVKERPIFIVDKKINIDD